MKKLETIPLSWWESINQIAVRGTPDILGVVNGWFVGLELKSENGKVSALQSLKLRKISGAQGKAFIVYPDNFDEVFEILMNLGSKGAAGEKYVRRKKLRCMESTGNYGVSINIESEASDVSELEIDETIKKIRTSQEARGSIAKIDN